ncbi:MAG: arginase family protein [Flavobacteriales bacterium]
MKPEEGFEAFTQEELRAYGIPRSGETRLWERVHIPENKETPLRISSSHPATFVLLGIPEDIGPRANLGKGGADTAWEAFLPKFLNIQENAFGIAERTLLAGKVRTSDLLERSEKLALGREEDVLELRKLTSELDQRVVPVIKSIVAAGKVPVVVGGGHNNAYGNLRGTAEGKREAGHLGMDEGVSCLNIDPHADLREMEGRHSGNGFSYAVEEGHLAFYAMLGLHKNYNPTNILQRFENAPSSYHPRYFEDILGEKEEEEALRHALDFLNEHDRPIGLEIDLDAIAGMAVSAETPSGFHENGIRRILKRVLWRNPISYLHLAEGAPENKPGYRDHVGKYLAFLVSDAIREASDPV